METIYLNRDNISYWCKKAKPNVMALGFFDGLHNGHYEVIKTAIKKAKELHLSCNVMSFFPHPKTILSGKKIDYLMPPSEKEAMLRKLGVDNFYIVEFDKIFAALFPEQFVTQYLLSLEVVHVVAGFDFTYGFKGTGHMDRLKSDSRGFIEVTKVEKIECCGEKVSSTCIRERLLDGKVEEIPEFLGRPYEVECDWDGIFSFKTYPYYTLPAPGRYVVTIKNERQSFETIVKVVDNQGNLSLTCSEKILTFIKGKVSIIWKQRIPEEKSQERIGEVLSCVI